MKSETHGEKLLGVQSARGLAALLVVLYHGTNMIALPQYVGFKPLGDFFHFGHAGVDFFFVLSGFIIYFVHRSDIGRPSSLVRYGWRRVTRIYPVYWVITGFVLLKALVRPDDPAQLDPVYLFKSILLLPQAPEPLLGVAWTLEHEMLFYLMFMTLIVSRRVGMALFAAWAVAVVGCAVAGRPSNEWLSFFVSTYHLQFFMGMVAAHMTRNVNIGRPLLLAGLGTVAFFGVGMIENAGLVIWAGAASQVLYGAAAMLVILGVALAELRGTLSVGKRSAVLGEASYSIYLTHTTVIGLTVRSLANIGILPFVYGWMVLIMVAVSALAFGGAFHRWVEYPLLKYFQRIGRTHVYPLHSAPRILSGIDVADGS